MCTPKKQIQTHHILPFEKKVWLSSPSMHGEELKFIEEAYYTNWMSTVGANIDEIEKMFAKYIGTRNAVALSCGTAAIHLALKLAAERVYHSSTGVRKPDGVGSGGSLFGKKVFCSDLTFAATVNPVVYEGGEPIFIDSEYETWNMDPQALEKAFSLYPDVKIIVLTNLYGVPAKMDAIQEIAKKNGALLIEDAAESLGATYKNKMTGSYGDYGIISFNGNKIITGSSGGMLLTDDDDGAKQIRKWSTQSREIAPWYQHQELGYNYRMSNVIAGIVRGQFLHLNEHISQKKKVYNAYMNGLSDLPITMNPVSADSSPNYWLSAMLINNDSISNSIMGDKQYIWKKESGKSSPLEIYDTLNHFNAESRPIWKPMHLQPIYRNNAYISAKRNIGSETDVGTDIFRRGLCLPSDNKMTEEQQNRIIDIIHYCFNG